MFSAKRQVRLAWDAATNSKPSPIFWEKITQPSESETIRLNELDLPTQEHRNMS